MGDEGEKVLTLIKDIVDACSDRDGELVHVDRGVELIAAFMRQVERETWDQLKAKAQDIIDAYPPDVFIEPKPGQHGKTIDACSASVGRHIGKMLVEWCRRKTKEIGSCRGPRRNQLSRGGIGGDCYRLMT